MSLIETGNIERPIIIVGKPRTGKTTMAMEMLNDPIVCYGNELINDSLPIHQDLLIEEVNYKPNIEEIQTILRKHKGKIILTSINKKSVPKKIINMCKIKLAGSKTYGAEIAPRSIPAEDINPDIFTAARIYLQNPDRERVANILKRVRPADTQIMMWLAENINPNRLIYVDAKVKRRWKQDSFYEMLAYAHDGRFYGKIEYPTKGVYSPLPKICRRLGIKEYHLLSDLLLDEDFILYVKNKLNNTEYRALGLGEKPRKTRPKKIRDRTTTLEDFL